MTLKGEETEVVIHFSTAFAWRQKLYKAIAEVKKTNHFNW